MSQVGHADSKMTLDVYTQLEQRIRRNHGVRFDAMVRTAQLHMHGEILDDSSIDDARILGPQDQADED
jgi:hypothetical protein